MRQMRTTPGHIIPSGATRGNTPGQRGQDRSVPKTLSLVENPGRTRKSFLIFGYAKLPVYFFGRISLPAGKTSGLVASRSIRPRPGRRRRATVVPRTRVFRFPLRASRPTLVISARADLLCLYPFVLGYSPLRTPLPLSAGHIIHPPVGYCGWLHRRGFLRPALRFFQSLAPWADRFGEDRRKDGTTVCGGLWPCLGSSSLRLFLRTTGRCQCGRPGHRREANEALVRKGIPEQRSAKRETGRRTAIPESAAPPAFPVQYAKQYLFDNRNHKPAGHRLAAQTLRHPAVYSLRLRPADGKTVTGIYPRPGLYRSRKGTLRQPRPGHPFPGPRRSLCHLATVAPAPAREPFT